MIIFNFGKIHLSQWFVLCFALIITHTLYAAENPVHLETITVTATKAGETDLQVTPISISSFDAADLDAAAIHNVRDLEHATPGLSISQNVNSAQVYIRGVGTNNIFPGGETSSTVHYDDVYLARPIMLFSDFLDIEKVEVLKGPQGTLYGRNSVGGTINIKPYLPTAETRIKSSLDIGNYNSVRIAAAASGALLENNVLGGISFFTHNNDGYIENKSDFDPDRLEDKERYGLRGTLRWLVTENSEFILSSDIFKKNETGPMVKPTYQRFDGSAPLLNPTVINDPFAISMNFPPQDQLRTWGTHGKFIWDINSDYRLSTITAYRKIDTFFHIDTDFTDSVRNDLAYDDKQYQISQELQLQKKTGRFTWQTGLYYFKEKDDYFFDLSIFSNQLLFDGNIDTNAYAAFFQGNYAFTETLSMILGTRFSYEKKQANRHLNTALPIAFAGKNAVSSKEWTPKIGLNIALNDDLFLFSSVSRGFKSGGFNFSSAPAVAEFDPEFLTAWEIGAKSHWLDKRLRLNSSVFYYDYKDLQVQSFSGVGSVVIDNAATAKIKGLELEANLIPLKNWQLDTDIAWLDARYKKYLNASEDGGATAVDASGNRLNASPEWTSNITLRYFQPFTEGMLSYRLNYYWQDKTFYTPSNNRFKAQNDYTLINASISYLTLDEQLTFTLYGQNLTNKAYFNTTYDYDVQNGILGKIMPPRTYGVKIQYQFE